MNRVPPPADRRPEERLLLALARPAVSPEIAEEIRRLLHASFDEDYFYGLVRNHEIAGLIRKNLRPFPEDLSHRLRHRLDQLAVQRCIKNKRYAEELIHVIDGLAEAGIASVPFKGPVLTQLLYGDLNARSFCDLDLLVRKDDVERSLEVLSSLGYRQTVRDGKHIGLHKERGNVKLELHWKFETYDQGINLADGIWDRLIDVPLGERMLKTLGPVDTFLYLCYHGTDHEWSRLKWVCDVAMFIERHPALPWPEVFQKAGELGLKQRVGVALSMAGEALGTELPEGMATFLVKEPLLLELPQTKIGVPGSPSLYHKSRYALGLRDTWADKWRFGLELLKPTPAEEAWVRLPLKFALFYNLIRPLRLILKYGLKVKT